MSYLEKHFEWKQTPELIFPKAHTAIVIGKPYFPHPYPTNPLTIPARTALYAQGADYHLGFKAELDELCNMWRNQFPNEEFLSMTDSQPILERDLAYRAGLGWIGKNSCLIHPQYGSLFWIGEILTSLALPNSEIQISDHCGTCDRCIRACPTQAIRDDRTLDATRCISYLTIEDKSKAPLELRTNIGDWFFGCDLCQTVCPWNEKAFGKIKMQNLSQPITTRNSTEIESFLRTVLLGSSRQIQALLNATPLMRARPSGLKRNALILIANLQLSSLRPVVEALSEQEKWNELGHWCLAQLSS